MSRLYLSNPCALLLLFAHGAAGAVGARLSLRLCQREEHELRKTQAESRREIENMCPRCRPGERRDPYAAALVRGTRGDGLLQKLRPGVMSPGLRRDDNGAHVLILTARFRLSFAQFMSLSLTEAQGKPGADCARSTVCKKVEVTHTVLTGTAETSRLSPRNGFNGFLRALPGERPVLPPSSAGHFLPT